MIPLHQQNFADYVKLNHNTVSMKNKKFINIWKKKKKKKKVKRAKGNKF